MISNGEPASESPAFRADKVYVKNHWASNETLGTNGQDPTVNDASNPVAVAIVEVTDRQWRTPASACTGFTRFDTRYSEFAVGIEG